MFDFSAALNLHLLATASHFKRDTVLARLTARRLEALRAARLLLAAGKAAAARRVLAHYWSLTKAAKLAASWQALPTLPTMEI